MAITADFLTTATVNGLVRLDVKTAAATASVYRQGAHLASWQPAGSDPVIFFSRGSELAPGKAFRGGVPIVFPWFAGDAKKDRVDGHPGPSHGFARIEDWTLVSAARRGDDAELVLTLGPTAMSRAMGYNDFGLTVTFTIGKELRVRLQVHNTGSETMQFEDGFHTYFRVTDIHETTVYGLEPTSYLDKTDGGKLKPAAKAPLSFAAKTDRVYNNTTAGCTIADVAGRRRIRMEKQGSGSTVVFNPFAALGDLPEWDWHNMLALEATNVGVNAKTLAPGAVAELGMTVSVLPALAGDERQR